MKGKRRAYIGETARNLYERSKDNYNDIKNVNRNSWMRKHIEQEHGGDSDNVNFSWRVLRKHQKPLHRQLHEAVKINNTKKEESLNSKIEFNGQRKRRVEVEKYKRDFICNICSAKYDTKHEVDEHVEKFHRRIKCDNCAFLAYENTGLKEHVKNEHKNTQI